MNDYRQRLDAMLQVIFACIDAAARQALIDQKADVERINRSLGQRFRYLGEKLNERSH